MFFCAKTFLPNLKKAICIYGCGNIQQFIEAEKPFDPIPIRLPTNSNFTTLNGPSAIHIKLINSFTPILR